MDSYCWMRLHPHPDGIGELDTCFETYRRALDILLFVILTLEGWTKNETIKCHVP